MLRLPIATLALAAFATGAVLAREPPGAPCLQPQTVALEGGPAGEIVGTYHGCVSSGGLERPVITTFALGPDGGLTGRYVFWDEEGESPGTLTDIRYRGEATFEATWNDKHGSGTLVVAFFNRFQMFSGNWGSAGGAVDPRFGWTGQRVQ
ncbi:MAG TPA: hypothetical protein VEH84_05680 [Alphaproteobacteria bacterium]|nr:hypothetical protein [Alphaproteobacteria bacterium]